LLLSSSKPSLGVFQLAGHFYFINLAPSSFLVPLPGNKEEEEAPTSTKRQQNTIREQRG
jgi:hypothetical protein